MRMMRGKFISISQSGAGSKALHIAYDRVLPAEAGVAPVLQPAAVKEAPKMAFTLDMGQRPERVRPARTHK